MPSEKTNVSGFTALVLVLAVCGFIGSFLILGFLPALLAVFFGHAAIRRIKKSGGRLGGMLPVRLALGFAYTGVFISLTLGGLLGVYLVHRSVSRMDPEQKAIVKSLRGKSAEQVEQQIMDLLDAGRQRDAEAIAFCLPPRLAGNLRLTFIQGILRRSRWSQMDAAYFFTRVREINPNTKAGKAARIVMDIDRGSFVDRNMQELAGLMEKYPEDMMITWLFAMSCREYFKYSEDTRYSEAGRKAYQKLDEFWDVGPSLFHQTYANILRELNLSSEALPHYQKSVELEPALWNYEGLLVCLRDLKDKEISVDICRAAFELCPGNSKILCEWGLALERQGKYTEAAVKYEEATALGSHWACHNLALLYECGRGFEKDLAKARELYEKSSSMGNARATHSLAQMYRDGVGVKADRQEAEELYLKAARNGYPKALENLGFMYDRGLAGSKDKVKAAEYYKQAAEAGCEWSAWKLACLYFDDPLMERDYEQSLRYFLLADKLKHVDGGMYGCIGKQYYKGLGVQTNILKAIEWWEKGYALKDTYSVDMLGRVYTYGIGVERNIPKALRLYRTAFKNGVKTAEDAMFRMPYEPVDEYRQVLAEDNDVWNWRVLIRALSGLERYDECIEVCRTALSHHPNDGWIINSWGLSLERQGKFEEAAVKYNEGIEAGNHWSCHNMALFLRNGRGVEKDLIKARELYEKSSGMGNARATCSLGEIYRDGLGCEPDSQKAEKYFLKAGKDGYPDGFAALGRMYCYGSAGCVIDKKKGLKYLEQASDKGSGWGAFNAGLFYYGGTDIKQDYAKSFKYFMRADELQYTDRSLPGYIAVHYQMGWGVTKDLSKAVEWWQKGVLTGDVYSIKSMASCYERGVEVARDFQGAVQLLERPEDSRCRASLAGLYSRAGQFEEAVRAQKEAIALIEKQRKDAWAKDSDLRDRELKQYQEPLLLFESGKSSDKWY